uniref:Uncharacterized protein n=1 Tax=Arion vulgaris TaxID=1028688 RepID=A0A0B7ATS5_9EUPU
MVASDSSCQVANISTQTSSNRYHAAIIELSYTHYTVISTMSHSVTSVSE